MLKTKKGLRLKKPAHKKLSAAGTASLVILLIIMFCSVFAPLVAPHDPLEFGARGYSPPSWEHPFGTDRFGRDTLSRVIYGSRVTLLMGMLAVALAGAAGLLAGVTAGYHGGLLDNMIMRVMESIAVIPFLLIAVLAAASKGFTATGSAIAIGVTLMPDFASWSRALVLNIHGSGFLEAERAFGIRRAVILFRHVLPNIFAQYIVKFTTAFAEAILAFTALGYIGIAVQPPKPEWGDLLSNGYASIMYGKWWLSVFPGLMILITVVCVNILGNNLSSIIRGRSGTNGGRS
jgi:peptide/nickel transport system permease protein